VTGVHQGGMVEPMVLLYDSHYRNHITGALPSGTEVQIELYQANPVLDFYFVRADTPAGPQKGWCRPPSFRPLRRPTRRRCALQVLVIDVIETLLDLTAMDRVEAVFGELGVRQEWFQQMLQLALVATVTDVYRDFAPIGRAARGHDYEAPPHRVVGIGSAAPARHDSPTPATPRRDRGPIEASRRWLPHGGVDQFRRPPWQRSSCNRQVCGTSSSK